MNRKLHNSLLAFSVTGLLLTMGLLAAGPAPRAAVSGTTIVATATPLAMAGVEAEAARRLAALDDASARIDASRADALSKAFEASVEARAEAFAARIERDPQADLGAVVAGALALATEATAEATLGKALAATVPEAVEARRGHASQDRARHARRIRSVFAVPYFSFAQGLRRGAGS